MQLEHLNKRSSLVSLALVVVTAGTILLTLRDYGVTWDEPVYFDSALSYVKWLSSPSLSTIDQYWSITHEHPPLTRILGGITNEIFNKHLGWFDEYIAFRISMIAFIIPMTLAFFAFARSHLGVWPALLVSLALFFHPHLFFHAHIDAMDYAIMAMWFVTAYAFWRSNESFWWMSLASIALGLSLLTKINGFALFAIADLALLLHLMSDYQLGKKTDDRRLSPPNLLILRGLILTVLPAAVFYLGWPWLWPSPIARFREFVTFFTHHAMIATYFFGAQYSKGPWYIPPVLTLIVTPVWIVGLFFVGLFSKAFSLKARIFVMANLLLALGIISASPSKHDGTRLFLPVFPFFYLIAGAGLVTIYRYFNDRLTDWKFERHFSMIFSSLAVLLLVLSIVQSVIRYHPYQTAYFNEIVGGDRGAVARGLEYEYWCSSYVEALEWLEKHSESTYWTPMCGHLFEYYFSRGLIKFRLKTGDEANSQYLILPSRFGFFDATAWNYYKNETSVFSVRAHEKNVLNIYALHRARDRNAASVGTD